jgi:F-type H+-transporting ATPase subunit b
VLTAVVTSGARIEVSVVRTAEQGDHAEEAHFDPADCEFEPEPGVAECGEGPGAITPEVKEIAWGGGSFIVLALLMRFFLYPRLKRGMDARYAHIRGGHEQADAMRASAKAEVADYEAALATVKSEANERIEAARRTLESERSAQLAEANARIAARREAANEAARSAREAASEGVAAAASDVAARTVELSIGKTPDAGTVRAAVDAAMSVGASS